MKPTTPFSRLSKADQRRAICRDVLAQIRAKKMKVATGRFLEFDFTGDAPTKSTSLRVLIKRATAPCQVCALGSILMSQVNLNGDCKVGTQEYSTLLGAITLCPFGENEEGKSMLFSPFMRRYFSTEQLHLIECAFECGDGAFEVNDGGDKVDPHLFADACADHDFSITREQAQAAIDFGLRYTDDTNRLRAIVFQIIRSEDATFTP